MVIILVDLGSFQIPIQPAIEIKCEKHFKQKQPVSEAILQGTMRGADRRGLGEVAIRGNRRDVGTRIQLDTTVEERRTSSDHETTAPRKTWYRDKSAAIHRTGHRRPGSGGR